MSGHRYRMTVSDDAVHLVVDSHNDRITIEVALAGATLYANLAPAEALDAMDRLADALRCAHRELAGEGVRI